MGTEPADERTEPEPNYDETFDQIAKGIGVLLLVLAVPPIVLYREVSVSKRVWRWRYYYLLFIPAGLITFAPQLLAGRYEYLAVIPVFHLVPLYVVGGGLVMMALQDTGFSLGLFSSVPTPTGVTLPQFAYLVAGTGVLLVGVGAVIYRYGRPGGVRWQVSHADLTGGKFAIPLKEIWQSSIGASRLPVLSSAVSTLVLGESGSGKTTAIQTILEQISFDSQAATLVHDFKTDYQDYFAGRDVEVVRLSIEDSDVVWNMFLDVEKERHYREIAASIMGEADGNDPFHQPATNVLYGAMVFLHREGEKDGTTPTHADLAELIQKPIDELYEILDDAGIVSAEQIAPDVGGANNVRSKLTNNVDPLLTDDFGSAGSFSLREWANNPDGQVLVVDNLQDESEAIGQGLRLLLDEAVRHSLASERDSNFVLDEIDQLPPLQRLSTVASAGRGEGVRALIGIQTIGQLEKQYEKATDGVLGNCIQGVYFGPGDSATVDYVLDAIGDYRERVSSKTHSKASSGRRSSSSTTREKERGPITSGELRDMGPGDVVVETRSEWWYGHMVDETVRKWL